MRCFGFAACFSKRTFLNRKRKTILFYFDLVRGRVAAHSLAFTSFDSAAPLLWAGYICRHCQWSIIGRGSYATISYHWLDTCRSMRYIITLFFGSLVNKMNTYNFSCVLRMFKPCAIVHVRSLKGTLLTSVILSNVTCSLLQSTLLLILPLCKRVLKHY